MHTPCRKPAAVILFLALIVVGCQEPKHPYPVTDRKPVTDEYYGVTIPDDYRWLDNPDDPAVRRWVEEQNSFSTNYFDQLPFLAGIKTRLNELYAGQPPVYSSMSQSGKIFVLTSRSSAEQKILVVMDSPDDPASEHVVVDPDMLAPDGTRAIDWFSPSGDGKLVAVAMSDNGSEDASAYLYDVGTGKELEVIPRVQYPTGGGSIAWEEDGKGFFYTRYPADGERPKEELHFYQQVWYHRIGTPVGDDSYVIGAEFPKIAEIRISSGEGGKYLLVKAANGDGGEFAHFLRGPDGKWKQITRFSDRVSLAVFAGNGMLALLSRMDAPKGKILTIDLEKPELAHAKVLVPESDASIADFSFGKKHLFVLDMNGGPSRLRMIDRATVDEKTIPLRENSSVTEFLVLDDGDLVFREETYLEPPAWYRYDPAGGTLVRISPAAPSGEIFGDAEVTREFAISKDGTEIPMDILRKKGTKSDGMNPAILYGYGGYGVSMVPDFRVSRRLWLDQGGVYVIAHLRGGGEFGEEWHEAGALARKQKVFDDFAACAEHLISAGWTDHSRLAVEGQSNGGLLMGAALTQHPELFRAVVSRVGIYDMLRSEQFPNGMFNTTEFGTVGDSAQFRVLYEYSPYHRVVDGTPYPAVLLTAGDHDGRVDPAN